MRTTLMAVLALTSIGAQAQSKPIAEFAKDAAGGPSVAVAMGDKLFFSAYDELNGRELWITDGTSEGTHVVKDIRPGNASGVAEYFELSAIAVDDVLYFRADDGVSGSELWRSDGTESGTTLVKDIQGGPNGSGPGMFAQVDGMLFFTAFTGSQLWRSNGSAAGTQLVRSFTVVTWLYGHQGTLFFAGDPDNTGQELWRSNGTFNTTERVKDLNGVVGASLPINFHSAGDLLYFDAITDTGWELWRTDGTEDGTLLVKDINPGGANGSLDGYSNVTKTNISDTLYFRANDGVNGGQLWRTNGSEASTVRVSDLPDGVDTYCKFPIVDGQVLMNNYLTDHWWAYDPSTDTTLQSGYPSGYYFNMLEGKYAFLDDAMFYAGKDTAFGCELWRADGTLGDEHRAQESHFTDNWLPGAGQPFTNILGVLNGQVLFTSARSAYDLDVALFSHDPISIDCPAPYLALSVPIPGDGLHVLFDRQSEFGEHEVRYRMPGSQLWEITSTGTGLAELDVDLSLPWEYNVKLNCTGGSSTWSPLFTYDPSDGPMDPDSYASILGDRAEDATTMRIYWTRTALQVGMQMRYRPYADTNAPWTMASNATGMRRLTDLQPATLYTYEYRFNNGGGWTDWSYTPLYFATGTSDISTGIRSSRSDRLVAWPDPASDRLHINGLAQGTYTMRIMDAKGRYIANGIMTDGQIEVGFLMPGSYLIEIAGKKQRQVVRFMKM